MQVPPGVPGVGAGGDSAAAARAGAAGAYVLLWSAQILAAKAFASKPHGLRAVTAACLAAELLKLAACGGALRAGPAALLARAVEELRAGPAGGHGQTLTFVIAGCYVVYNLLSYINLAVVPASTYKALLSARLAFAVGLDAARTGLCPAHRAAGAAAAAGAALVVSPFKAEGSLSLLLVCAQAFLSALAGALTQRVLQAHPGAGAPLRAGLPHGAGAGAAAGGEPSPSGLRRYLVSLAERNASLYAVTSAALAACLGALMLLGDTPEPADHPRPKPLSPQAVAALSLSVALSAAAGLSTSHLLTVAGNVAKAMLAGAEVCAVTLASAFLFGEPLTWRIGAGAALTLLAFALHERVLPLPAALLARLPESMQPGAEEAAAAAPPAHKAAPARHGEEAPRGGACARAATLAAAAAAAALLLVAGYRRELHVAPRSRLASYVEARDAPLTACAAVPPLWPGPYVAKRPRQCEPPYDPYYELTPQPHGATELRMRCPGGVARYTPNFMDATAISGALTFAQGSGSGSGGEGGGGAGAPSVTLSHKITHLDLTCTQLPAGARAPRTRREVALLGSPLARQLEMAGRAAADVSAEPRPPHVIVILMDALSRATADSVLPRLQALLRAPSAFGDQLAAALEFKHFQIVGMSSAANWGALFCGGNCSGAGSGGALPLLDAARDAGFATLHMNNFCPPYPYPWSPGGAGPEVTINQRVVCIQPGDYADCRMHDSVTRSWLSAGVAALAAPRPATAPPLYALLAPHEAHSRRPREYDRLQRLEPDLIAALRTLNASGTLAQSLLLLVADHGLHYRLRKELFAPAAEAHRGPLLWALVGARVARELFATAGGEGDVAAAAARAHMNAAERLVTMHDMYRTLAEAARLDGAAAGPGAGPAAAGLRVTPRPEALNVLRTAVPPERTCRQAGVPEGYCACLQRKGGVLG